LATDPKDSKKIYYHTRSPASIREELKDRRSRGFFDNPRKRKSILFLFFSFLLIIGSLVGIYFFRGTYPVTSEFTAMVDSLMIRISAQSVYEIGELPEITVRISNSLSRPNSFEIQDFEFRIRTHEGKQVFHFRYPFLTSVVLDRYDARIVYDFLRENPNFAFEGGLYVIEVMLTINGKEIPLTKTMEIREKVLKEVYLLDDFAVPDQRTEPFLRLGNYTSVAHSFVLGEYRYDLSKDRSIGAPITGRLHDSHYLLDPGEVMDFSLTSFIAPSEAGIYHLNSLVTINSDIVESVFPFEVHPISPDRDLNSLRIRSFFSNYIPVHEHWEVDILLTNDADRPLYTKITGFELIVFSDLTEIFRYESDRTLQLKIPQYSNRLVFSSRDWKKLSFFSEGTYTVSINIRMGDHLLTHESKLYVVPKEP